MKRVGIAVGAWLILFASMLFGDNGMALGLLIVVATYAALAISVWRETSWLVALGALVLLGIGAWG